MALRPDGTLGVEFSLADAQLAGVQLGVQLGVAQPAVRRDLQAARSQSGDRLAQLTVMETPIAPLSVAERSLGGPAAGRMGQDRTGQDRSRAWLGEEFTLPTTAAPEPARPSIRPPLSAIQGSGVVVTSPDGWLPGTNAADRGSGCSCGGSCGGKCGGACKSKSGGDAGPRPTHAQVLLDSGCGCHSELVGDGPFPRDVGTLVPGQECNALGVADGASHTSAQMLPHSKPAPAASWPPAGIDMWGVPSERMRIVKANA